MTGNYMILVIVCFDIERNYLAAVQNFSMSFPYGGSFLDYKANNQSQTPVLDVGEIEQRPNYRLR